MAAMTPTVTGLPPRRSFTYADLELMPDDGHRYEIIDGVLIVSASPVPLHQRVVKKLLFLLDPVATGDIEAFIAPLDVKLADDTVLIPDVLLARSSDIGRRGLDGAPLLAIEVLSPSTRNIDLTLKKQRLEQAGCPHYWIVDPEGPSMIAWELIEDEYVEVGRAEGQQTLTIPRPFALTVTPGDLVVR